MWLSKYGSRKLLSESTKRWESLEKTKEKKDDCDPQIYAFLALLIAFCPAILATMAKPIVLVLLPMRGRHLVLHPRSRNQKVLGFYMVGEELCRAKIKFGKKGKEKAFNNGKADFVRFMKEDLLQQIYFDLTNNRNNRQRWKYHRNC